MQISLKFNFDGHFSVTSGPFSNVGFNSLRVGVWAAILALSVITAVVSPFYRRWDSSDRWLWALGTASSSVVVSGTLLLLYAFRYPTSPSARLEFTLASFLSIAWLALSQLLDSWSPDGALIQFLGLLSYLLLFPYVVYVAILGVRAQKRGVERVWRRPVHTIQEGGIALSESEGEDAETGLGGRDADSVTPAAPAEVISGPQQ